MHIDSEKALLTWSRAELIAWFESGMKINPTQIETDYLNKKLDIALSFVISLEQGLVHEAMKIAREEWRRGLSKKEIIYFLRHYQGVMTVVLSINDGASIELKDKL